MQDKRISPTWSHMVLSSGGMAGLTYLGAIGFLQENTRLAAGIKNVAGTSIGAFFALLFALGAPMLEVEAHLRVYLTRDDVSEMAPDNLFLTYGIDDGDRMIEPARHFLNQILGVNDITFIDLAKARGISLTFCATCLNTGAPTYFSVDSTPDVSVLDACRASMAVPFLFTPVKIGDQTYVDGAVADNFPINCFNQHNDILGLYILSDAKPRIDEPLSSAIEYARALANAALYRGTDARRYQRQYKHVCVFDENPIPTFPILYNAETAKVNMIVDEACIAASYSYGYESMTQFFDLKCSPEQTPPEPPPTDPRSGTPS